MRNIMLFVSSILLTASACLFLGHYSAEIEMAKGILRCKFIYENKVCWNPKETIEGVKDEPK